MVYKLHPVSASILLGVSQGSVLRPILFVSYTAPLSTATEKHSILHHSYTDDSQLQKSAAPHQIPDLLSMQKCRYWVRQHPNDSKQT